MVVFSCKLFTFVGTGITYIGTKLHYLLCEFRFPFVKGNALHANIGTIPAKGYTPQVVFANHVNTFGCTAFAGCKTVKARIYH
jgi:hypothetical protein